MSNYIRIATEEAFAPPELVVRYRKLLEDGYDDPGFRSLWGFYSGATPRATALAERIQDLGDRRLHDMDSTGIAMQILSLTAPGVQVFDAPEATALARSFNDQLADAIRKHPDRFSGLAAIAPQDPAGAAKELERGVRQLGAQGRHRQQPHARRIPGRSQVLGHLRSGRGAKRPGLHSPHHAAEIDDRSVPGTRPRRRHLRLRCRNRAAPAAHHRQRASSTGFPRSASSPGTWAKPFPTGCSASISCTATW